MLAGRERFDAQDRAHMQAALDAALAGLYSTDPNPRVGCVLVRDGERVASGAHLRAGGEHAEVAALREAGPRARGAHAYVTLEPCCHQGRTGPCTDALRAAGVSAVTYACADPDPQVAGGGARRLREAGLAVRAGLLAEDALRLNPGFFSRHLRGRPWLRLKLAISLDGKVAAADRHSQWITGAEARADNQRWRARASALLTGSGTLLADDPRLTVRAGELGEAVRRVPARVLLARRFEVPGTARVLEPPGEVIVIGSVDGAPRQRLTDHGVTTALVADHEGRVDLHAALAWLAGHGVNELHVECGPTLAGSLLDAGLVDELLVYQADVLLGDRGLSMLSLPALARMADARRLPLPDIETLGADRRLHYLLTDPVRTLSPCSPD
jgi:diaminohydroxyphosphoribosylaminopyrimidine deaminase/5-amino-6-(5-phosphoribosylamino)uracil reductase